MYKKSQMFLWRGEKNREKDLYHRADTMRRRILPRRRIIDDDGCHEPAAVLSLRNTFFSLSLHINNNVLRDAVRAQWARVHADNIINDAAEYGRSIFYIVYTYKRVSSCVRYACA